MSEQSSAVFYRRCHVCNHVNHSDEPVLKCDHCEQVMAPFFYFDVRKTRVHRDSGFDNVPEEDQYRPIEGLTAFW